MEIAIRSISQAAYVAESYMGFKNIKQQQQQQQQQQNT